MNTPKTPQITSNFITELIKQDLRIFRVRQGLGNLGFVSENFYSDIPHMVYELMGIEEQCFEDADECYTAFLHTLRIELLEGETFLDFAAISAFGHLGEKFGYPLQA